MLYLLTLVAILMMFIGLVWLILRRGRQLRKPILQQPKIKYFDLRGETDIDEPDEPPHEPSYDERKNS